MYIVKITFLMPHRCNNIKNANINPREIAFFVLNAREFIRAKLIYIHSNKDRHTGSIGKRNIEICPKHL